MLKAPQAPQAPQVPFGLLELLSWHDQRRQIELSLAPERARSIQVRYQWGKFGASMVCDPLHFIVAYALCSAVSDAATSTLLRLEATLQYSFEVVNVPSNNSQQLRARDVFHIFPYRTACQILISLTEYEQIISININRIKMA